MGNLTKLNDLWSTTNHTMDLLEEEYEKEQRVSPVFLTLYGIFIPLILVGNGVFIVLVICKKKLRTTTNCFVVSLCISDVAVAAFAIPMSIMGHFSEKMLNTHSCRLLEYCVHTSLCANIYSVVAVAVDRYRSVVFPHAGKLTIKKGLLIIGICWGFSLAYAARVISWYDIIQEVHRGKSGWENFLFCRLATLEAKRHIHIYVLVDFCVIYILPLLLISFMYFMILKKVLKRKNQVTPTPSMNYKGKRLLRMLVFIVFVFAVCQLPIRVYELLRYWRHYFPGYLIVEQACEVISFSNSWLNVYAYACLNENLKRELVKCLTRRSTRNEEESCSDDPKMRIAATKQSQLTYGK